MGEVLIPRDQRDMPISLVSRAVFPDISEAPWAIQPFPAQVVYGTHM